MTSSLTLVFPSGYRSASVLVSGRPLFSRHVEGRSWRCVHAAEREEASDAVKAPLSESPKSKDGDGEGDLSSFRSAGKGFGPRPPPPPPKPPRPSLSSKDKKSLISRRPSPSGPIGLRTPDPVLREQDNVFIVGLTVLGVLIFIEGIAVAASGLLSDELDAFIVKYVYPAFTPTVGLFLVGAVAYGVFKLRQGADESDKPS